VIGRIVIDAIPDRVARNKTRVAKRTKNIGSGCDLLHVGKHPNKRPDQVHTRVASSRPTERSRTRLRRSPGFYSLPRLGHKPSSPNARIRIWEINGRWQRQRQLLRVDRGAIYKCEAAPGNAKFPTARPTPLHQEEGHRADRFATQRPGLLKYVTTSKPCGVARMNRRCRELTPGTIELQVKPCLRRATRLS